jgi:hypothetical protein
MPQSLIASEVVRCVFFLNKSSFVPLMGPECGGPSMGFPHLDRTKSVVCLCGTKRPSLSKRDDVASETRSFKSVQPGSNLAKCLAQCTLAAALTV